MRTGWRDGREDGKGGGGGETKRTDAKQYTNGLPVSLRGSRKGARSVMRILEGERERERKIQSERWTERRGKGGREGRRLTQRGLCCFCCLLPVRRVFAYPRHDRDPICIAPMKLLPAYAEPPLPSPSPSPLRPSRHRRDHSRRARGFARGFTAPSRRRFARNLGDSGSQWSSGGGLET